MRKRKINQKAIAIILTLAMLMSMVPTMVFAGTGEGDSPSRTIISIDSSASTTQGRFHRIYLSTEGSNTSFNSLKANGYFPEGTSNTITWASANAGVVTVNNPTGSTNGVTAIGSGKTAITASCNGASYSVDVVVMTKEEMTARMVELAKLLPTDNKLVSLLNLDTVEELASLMKFFTSAELTALGNIEGNEAFKNCLTTSYKYGSIYDVPKLLTSTNIAPTGGLDFYSMVDTYNEFKKDRSYLSESQKTSLDSLGTAIDEINPKTGDSSIVYTAFKTKINALKTQVRAYVASLVSDLPASEDVTLADENQVIVARNAYTALAPTDKSFVDTAKLTAAEAVIKELKSIVLADSVSVSPERKTISVGATTTLTYKIMPEGTTDQSVTWESENKDVATVDSNGKVKGLAQGEAKITATTANGKTAAATITVDGSKTAVESVSFEKESTTITMGKAETLIVSINPEEATNQELLWESSDNAIATVDENGRVIGIKAGEATITVRSADEGSTATDTCKVTVNPREPKSEPTVYFQYDNGLIQDMDENKTFTIEQSDSGKFCLEGTDIEPFWRAAGDSLNGYVYQVFGGTGAIIPRTVGTAAGWVLDDYSGSENHIVDYTVKIVPSTISQIKMYVDDQEVNESSIIRMDGQTWKTIKVMGKRDGDTYYTEVPYYGVDYTGSDIVSFGTSASANKFCFENPGASTIKVAIKNSTVSRSFKATSGKIDVENIELNVPSTFYIDAWNGNGGEYVGLTQSAIGTSAYYSINVLPDTASDQNVTWTSYNPDIAIFKVEHVNGFLPLKAGTAEFRVTSNSNPSVYKDVTINFEYKNPAKSVSILNKNLEMNLSDGSIQLPISYTTETSKMATEQRMDWSYSTDGIVRVDSTVSTSGGVKTTKHTLTALKTGTVTVTGTPWDTTGGATPITFTITVKKGDTVSTDITKIINDGKQSGSNYLKGNTTFQYGDEWSVMSLLRSGNTITKADKLKYYQNTIKGIKEDSRFGVKSTDISRTILGLQAAGFDASKIGEFNLLEMLYNYNDNLETMGSNDVAFALIALDSNKTEIPATANWSRDRLVNTLLKYQIASGGFSLSMPTAARGADSASVDMTAMCLTALAPYAGDAKVKVAIDAGVQYLRDNLSADASYDNSNSISQVITALSAIGVDFMKEGSGFTAGVNNLLTSLEKYRVGANGFKYNLDDPDVNGMATQQALYALEAYNRFISGSNALYDFTDVKMMSYDEMVAMPDVAPPSTDGVIDTPKGDLDTSKGDASGNSQQSVGTPLRTPKTGDETLIGLFAILFLISGIGVVAVRRKNS